MNQIYRVIWSRLHGSWTVVAESVKSSGKTHSGRMQKTKMLRTALAQCRDAEKSQQIRLRIVSVALALALMPLASWSQTIASNALPVGGTVSAGQATISQSGSQMNIVQSTDKAALNWNSFNIGSGAGVTFQQPGSQSVALNRVAGADPSQIFGTLTANGKVILINPNGVVFGAGSRIDASGLVATTKALSDADFMAGNYHFSGGGSGVVRNDGTIIASPDGGVLLSADKVINTGTIQVRGGSIGMVSASDLQMSADWRSATVIDATSSVANNVAVDNSGTLDVSGATGGKIALQGSNGVTQSSGQLLATGEQGTGGQIHLSGQKVILQTGGTVDASGAAGGGEVLAGGDWQGGGTLQRATETYMDKDVVIKANATAQGDGGKVVLWADDYTRFNGKIEANGAGGGNGGMVETSGQKVLDVAGSVTAVGTVAGSWLLDPTDVSITSSGSGALDGSGTYNPATFGTISNTTINNALNAGTNVTISNTAGTGGTGFLVQNADAPISKTAGGDATLNLRAYGNVQLNAGITSTVGKLNVSIISDTSNTGTGAIAASTISTNGGNIDMTASSGIALNGVLTTAGGNVTMANNRNELIDARTGATINAGTGNINITNTSPGGVPNVGWISLRDLIGGNITIANNVPDFVAGQNVLLLNGTTTASGTVTATTQTGNVWVNQDITSTLANNASAIILGAATPKAAGDSTGGNVTLVNGSKLVVAPTSRAIIYTGSVADSTGIDAGSAGEPGAGRYRYNVVYNNTSKLPTSTGTYVQYREQPTLTLNLADKVYDAVALNSGDWNSYSVSGWKNGDTGTLNPLSGNLSLNGSTATVAKNVNNYTVALGTLADTLGYRLDVSGTPTYRITPAPLTVNGVAASKNYGHNDPTLTYTASGFVGGETATTALSGNLGRNSGENVGSYSQTQGSLVATSGNYTITFTAAQLAINKDTASPVTVIGNTLQKDYGTNDPTLTYTSSGFVNGGVQSYNAAGTLQTVTIADNAGNSLTGNLGRNSGENVGGYATTLGSLASANYVINFTPGQLNIVKNAAASLNVAGDSLQKNYGDDDPTLTYVVTSGLVNGSVQSYNTAGNLQTVAINDTATGSLTGNLGRNTGENVGNYATTIGSLISSNYNINFTAGQLAINKNTAAPLNVAGNAVQKVYGTDDPTLTYNVTSGLLNRNVQSYNTTGTLQTVAINDTAAGSLTGNLGRNGGENVNSYATTQGSLASSNYAINFTAGSLNITPASVSIVADAKSKTYGTDDPTLTYSYNNSSLVNRTVSSYDTAGNTITTAINDTVTGLQGSLGRQSGENVGSYAITKGSLGSPNYDVTFSSVNLDVTRAALDVTANAQNKIYGQDDPTLTYATNGLVNGSVQSHDAAGNVQTVAINDTSGSALSGNLGRQSGEGVGNRAITQGSLAASNYTIAFTPANLSIGAATLGITADAQSKSFGTNDPTLGYTSSGLINRNAQVYDAAGTLQTVAINDTNTTVLTGNLGRQSGESVGTYGITQGSLAGANYTLSFTGANLDITQAILNVVANAQTKTYGQDDPDLDYTYTTNAQAQVQSYDPAGNLNTVAVAGGGTPQFIGHLGRDVGETVAQYQIRQGSLAAANYQINYTANNLNITPASVSIVADAKSKTFGSDDPSFTYTSDNNALVNRTVRSYDTNGNVMLTAINDTINGLQGNLGRVSGENVGQYQIVQGNLGSPNYALTFTPVDLTITPAAMSVVANAQSKNYGQDDPDLNYTYSNSTQSQVQSRDINGNLVTVAVTGGGSSAPQFAGNLGRVSGENVGSYGITQGSLTAANYNISYTPAQLAINASTDPGAILNVAADGKTKVYGDADPTLTYQVANPSAFVNRTVRSYDANGNVVTTTIADNAGNAITGSLSRASGEDVGSYGIGQGSLASQNYLINYSANNLDILQRLLTISGLTVATRTYDTTTNAQISGGSLNGVLAADLGGVTLDATAGNFIDKNVGTNKDVLVNGATLSGSRAHNYAVNYAQSSTTGTITPAELLLSGIVASDKVYDGNTNATYQGTPTLSGVFASDAGKVNAPVTSLSGNFTDKNAGIGKVVTPNVASAVLTGAEAGNYVVTQITPDVNKATITPAELKITGTSDSKLFDGTTSSSKTPTVAGLVGGDSVSNLRQEFDTEFPSREETKNMMVLNGFVVNDGNGGQNYVVKIIEGKGQIKGIPMGEDLAGLSSSGGSSSNNFVQSSRNLELINPVGALEDIRQKAEQANYFLKANPAPAGTATHVQE